MLRPSRVAEAIAPKIHRKIETEQPEEEPSHFQPQNAADASKRTQKAADAASGCPAQLVRLLLHRTDFAGVGNGSQHRLVYGSCVRRWRCNGSLGRSAGRLLGRVFGSGRFLGALLCDASCDAYSDAQFFPKRNWFPTFYDASSCPNRESEVR
jgi:hypothetical protein